MVCQYRFLMSLLIFSFMLSGCAINKNDTTIVNHSDFIQSVIRDGAINRKQFIDRLRDQSDYIGLNTSIIFMGKNNNENGSAQVLQYQNKSLKTLGVYDGESFNYTSK